MEIKSAEFVTSSQKLESCPPGNLPEYAFIGRSNVGKSSLINMLTSKKNLAKTSSTPGKTQLINHFIINKDHDAWYLVDLPGIGFAKAPQKVIRQWDQALRHYLRKRENLMCVLMLIDIRLEPQKRDLEFMEWMGENGIPFIIVFTKCDKLKDSQLDSKVKAYADKMLETWMELPDIFITSSSSHAGRQELLDWIGSINATF